MKNEPSERIKLALDRFGPDACIKAFEMWKEGETAEIIGLKTIATIEDQKPVIWGNRAIEAGKYLLTQKSKS